MRWIPEFLEPFGPVMALLAVAGCLTVALAIHRVANYMTLSSRLGKLLRAADATVQALTAGRWNKNLPVLAILCEYIRRDSSDANRQRYFQDHCEAQRLVDDWVDRGLGVLTAVAPMLGLAGTVLGMIGAFAAFGEHAHEVTLKELGQPVSTALKTTLYGVCCAAVCVTARRLCPVPRLHREQRRLIDAAWARLADAFDSFATGNSNNKTQPQQCCQEKEGPFHDAPHL